MTWEKMIMKRALTCLAVAICAQLAFEALAQTTVQLPAVPRVELAHRDQYQLSYGFSGGGFGDWLIVQRHNLYNPENGFAPHDVKITSEFKPLVRKLEDGRWEIVFTSERMAKERAQKSP
jgi:hypothetical protein